MRGFLLLIIIVLAIRCSYAQEYSRYNTDSLISVLAQNAKIHKILIDGRNLYDDIGLDTANISRTAFMLAYLEKRMIDHRRIHIRKRHWYKNKKILTVVDFTKQGNMRRFATIDIRHRKLLFDTLVSQGSGNGTKRNDKYKIPVFFSNTPNSEVSSLGMILTWRARQPENPCHFCKFALTNPHKCTIILQGLEPGINDNVKIRDIVMHTTGSIDPGTDGKEYLGIEDSNYRVNPSECKCYRTGDDGSVKRVGAYASACGLAENNDYIGQSNGCLVLPEDDHVAIMKTIRRRSLIFMYSDVVTDGYNYFRDSHIIAKICKYANR